MHPLSINIYSLSVFCAIWVWICYGINRVIAGRPLKVKAGKLILYVTTMAALGLIGEILFDTGYKWLFGQPLWLYQLTPIHSGYTSIFSICLWGATGFYICLLHETLKKKHLAALYILTTIFCVEAVLFELFTDLSYHALFGGYIYYYLPNNMWHFTALQAIPLYWIAGLIVILIFEYAKKHQDAATLGSTFLVMTLALVK